MNKEFLPDTIKLAYPISGWKWILLLIFFGTTLQTYTLDPTKSIKQYTHEAWTSETTLPQSSVQTILQSKDGYLWLGTQEGLVRFDGVNFVQLNSEDISSLCEDREGRLWMATYNGVMSFHKGKFQQYTTNNGLGNNRCNSISIDSAGALWVATNAGASMMKEGKFTTFTTKDGLPSDRTTSVATTGGGVIWIGTPTGLSKYEKGRFSNFTVENGLPKNEIGCLLEGSDGTLWIGTIGGGLCAYKKGIFNKWGIEEGLPAKDVRSLYEDRDGSLWIGFEPGGIARFRDGKFESYMVKDGLSDNTVWSIFEDKEGSLWVGTFGGGLNRFKDAKFTSYDVLSGLSSNSCWVIYEDSLKNIWIGTDDGLNCFSNGKFLVYNQQNGLPDNFINTILEDREGSIWIGTDAGLSQLRDGRFTNFGTGEGLTNLSVFSLFEDRQGTIWIGTNGGGLNYIKNGKIGALRTSDGLSEEYIRAIMEDRQGNLWVGTGGAGLNLYKDGKFRVFSEKDGLSNPFIRALHEDKEGNIWIGTRGGGLFRYKDEKFDKFTMSDGLLSDVIFQVLEDGQNNLWMSCNKGIFKVSKGNLEEFAAKKITSISCTSFGKADGMKNAECTGGTQPAGWKTKDGVLWFPTIRGVVCIDPLRLRYNDVPPQVVIEEVRIDGKTFQIEEGVDAPPGSDRIEFKFTALSFLVPEKVRFKYMLEGHDKEWIDLPALRDRVATYTNIAPGKYTFHVKACNNDGLWNERGINIPFTLKPQFHQTWLFYFLIIFLILIIGGLIYHFTAVALVNFRIGRTLARYHSQHVIENIRTTKGSSESELSTERRRLTIMFGDLLGFSTFSDKSEPEVVDRVINEYLTEMANIIESKDGTIARFMGDGIMAFFGAPAKMEAQEQAIRAVEAAVFMQKKMFELEKKWLNSGIDHTLKLRLGISQDYATVGNMGSSHLMEYTALGSAVNLASRLETGCTPGKILVSFPVYVATKEIYPYDQPVMREFKGFAHQINVAELDPSNIK